MLGTLGRTPPTAAEAPHAGERLGAAVPHPVVVLESFIVNELNRPHWHALSKELRAFAIAQDGCKSSRLMTDRHDPNHYVIVSDWNDIERFNQFIRSSGVRWRERAVCPDLRGEFTILEAAP